MAFSTFMLLGALLYVIDFFAGGIAALSWLPRIATILLIILACFFILLFGLFVVWCYMVTMEPIGVLTMRMKANAQALHPQYSRFEILLKRTPNLQPVYATNPGLDSWEGRIVGYDKNNHQHVISYICRRDSSGQREIIKQLDHDLAEKVRVNGPEYQLHAYGL